MAAIWDWKAVVVVAVGVAGALLGAGWRAQQQRGISDVVVVNAAPAEQIGVRAMPGPDLGAAPGLAALEPAAHAVVMEPLASPSPAPAP